MNISHLFLLKSPISLYHTTFHIGWAVLVSVKVRQTQTQPVYQKQYTSSTLLGTLPAYLVSTGFLMCSVNWWACWSRMASAGIMGLFPCGHLSSSTLAWACFYRGHRGPRESRSVQSLLKPGLSINTLSFPHCVAYGSHNSRQMQGEGKETPLLMRGTAELHCKRCKYWEKWLVIFALYLPRRSSLHSVDEALFL